MKRPWEVILLATMAFAAAAIAIVVSVSLLAPGTWLDRMWQLNVPAHDAFAPRAGAVAALLLMVGVMAASTGVGLLTRQVWAWLLALAGIGINVLGDVVSLLITRDWTRGPAGILVDGVFLYLLLRPSVRTYFLARR
jgi:hypothetical protein